MKPFWIYPLILLLALATLPNQGVLAQDGTPATISLKGIDIGDVGETGSTAFDDKAGQHTVAGSGGDIFGDSDQFHYAYMAWSGDGQIVARVTKVDKTNKHAKAGVMFRETLDADAKNAVMEIKAATGSEFQYRQRTGEKTSYNGTRDIKAPYYVRLVRRGDTLTGYRSPDGVKWTEQSSATVAMAKDIYVGLSVTAHNNDALNTSTFDKVKISSELPPVPKPISVKGNTGVTGFLSLIHI